MSSSVRVSSFITYGSWTVRYRGNSSVRCRDINKKEATAFWILWARVSAYPDLAELHLDLFGDNVGPVLLSQEVPEYPSQKSIHPGLGLHRLPWTPADLKDRVISPLDVKFYNGWASVWGKSNLMTRPANSDYQWIRKILECPKEIHLLCSIDICLNKPFDRSPNSAFFFYWLIRLQAVTVNKIYMG